MTDLDKRNPSAAELVRQFEIIASALDKAQDRGKYKLYGRLLEELQGVQGRLELMSSDGLLGLLPLLKSSNEHVRLQAARALVTVSYTAAREVLQQLADDVFSPCCLDAGFTLDRLDGIALP